MSINTTRKLLLREQSLSNARLLFYLDPYMQGLELSLVQGLTLEKLLARPALAGGQVSRFLGLRCTQNNTQWDAKSRNPR